MPQDPAAKELSIELKVAGGSPSTKVAGSIVKYMQEGYKVHLQAMGAGAVNQAVKALILSRGYAAVYGWNLSFVAGFCDETMDGIKKTVIRFTVIKGE